MILTSLVLDGLHPAACRHASMRISCIPSRPAIMCTAQTGRTQDCTRPQRQTIKSTLAMREPSTQDIPADKSFKASIDRLGQATIHNAKRFSPRLSRPRPLPPQYRCAVACHIMERLLNPLSFNPLGLISISTYVAVQHKWLTRK